MTDQYTPEEQAILLGIARAAIEAAANGQPRPHPDLAALPPALREPRACFVTLFEYGELRGCTGTLAARRPLADEVSATAIQTAFNDPRFMPVTAQETPSLRIEISVLTPPQTLPYDSPDDLLHKLRPGVDGVLLSLGPYRSTFLPQVWENHPDPAEFLSLLCRKAGLPADAWKTMGMRVEVYQAISFEESHT
ncbi:MAG: AmmeMemoRadiSam system protein A [Anaerolineae bacterium]|nr:AmmeMemoRadiSam system protein A [Anaerolineae bacterium]